ncbi:MAG: hypothetical protein P4L53_19730 [Candidatus Obscuribacterales bacterium]|nr:hypothetical protein [Candidatus Obscuribacterales bacterium]
MISQNKIQIAPAVVRLTQVYARAHQLSFRNRVARLIAEESILALDPLLDFSLDESSSLSEIDALTRVIPVNDIVINGRHIDVAVVDLTDNGVTLPCALAQSNYCCNGSLVVSMSDTASGSIVGYIEPRIWMDAAQSIKHSTELTEINYLVSSDSTFDLEKCLTTIFANGHSVMDQRPEIDRLVLQAADYIHFLREPSSIPLSKQIKIINNCLADSSVCENLTALCEFQADNLQNILGQSVVWEARLSNFAVRLQAKYPDWQLSQLVDLLRSTGNKFGGQFESSAFKLNVARTLLAKKTSTGLSARVQSLSDSMLEQLFAGKKVVESVRQYVKNQIAVDIAAQIQTTRKGLLDLSQATTDEITAAVRQLSLQPAYATHSQGETSPVDDINEALQLFAIGKIGDELDHLLSEN